MYDYIYIKKLQEKIKTEKTSLDKLRYKTLKMKSAKKLRAKNRIQSLVISTACQAPLGISEDLTPKFQDSYYLLEW